MDSYLYHFLCFVGHLGYLSINRHILSDCTLRSFSHLFVWNFPEFCCDLVHSHDHLFLQSRSRIKNRLTAAKCTMPKKLQLFIISHKCHMYNSVILMLVFCHLTVNYINKKIIIILIKMVKLTYRLACSKRRQFRKNFQSSIAKSLERADRQCSLNMSWSC